MVEINARYLMKQTFWMYLFAYITIPIGYLIRVLYARSFSIEEFGLIYSIIGFLSIVSIFNDFGFTETLNYYATRFYEKKEYAKVKGSLYFAFFMQLFTSTLISLIFFFISPWLATNFFKTTIAKDTFNLFILYFWFYNVSRPFVQIFVATHKYAFSKFTEFFRNLIILLVSFVLIYFKQSNVIFIGAIWGLSYFLLLISSIYIFRQYYPELVNVRAELSSKLFKQLWSYAIIAVIASGALLFLSRTDIFLLTLMTNLKDVGVYNIALSIAGIIFTIISPAITIIFPLTSKLGVYQKNQVKEIIKLLYNFGLFVSMPLLISFIAFPKEIIILLFGTKYLIAKNCLIILSIAHFIAVLNAFNLAIMGGLGLIKRKAHIFYIGAITNLLLNIFLIPQYGIEGVAFATLISFVIMFILGLHSLREQLGFNLNNQNIFRIIILNIFMLGLVLFLKYFINLNIFIEAMIIVIISSMTYLLMGYYLRIIDYNKIFSLIFKKSKVGT